MIAILNDPIKWDKVAQSSYFPCISYNYGWQQAISEHYPHLKSFPLAKILDDGEIEYICPCIVDTVKKELISLPFVSPGFISCNSDPTDILHKIIYYAKKEKCRKILIQIPPGFDHGNILIEKGFVLINKMPFYEVNLTKLKSFDDYLNSSVQKRKRRYYNSAIHNGVKIHFNQDSDKALDRFYSLYYDIVGGKGREVLDRPFLEKIGELNSSYMRYFIVEHKDIDLGACLCFELRDRIWAWLIASKKDYFNFEIDEYIYIEIVRYAFNKHLSIVDFGTSPLNSSLSTFKERLGARANLHELYEFDGTYGGLISSMFRRMKKVIKYKWLS